MGWQYLKLTDAASGGPSAGGSLEGNQLYSVMTDKLGVKPGTHRYLRVDDTATYQGTPLHQLLVEQGVAAKISQDDFNKAENFRKRTIQVEDLTGIDGAGGPTM